MTVRERLFWECYELINGPVGEKRADWHAAQICEAVLRAGDKKKEDDSYYKTQELLLAFEQVLPPDPEDAILTKNRQLAQLTNDVTAFFGKFR